MKQTLSKLIPVGMLLISVLIITIFIGSTPVSAGTGKTVRVSTEKALNKAVKNKDVTSIIFRTNAYIKVTIKANKAAASKDLTIDAPNADITNKSVFTGIFLQSSGNYVEAADGNTFEVYDDYYVSSFTVEKNKTVKQITFINPDARIYSFFTIRKGAKIEEMNLIYSYGGKVGYSTFDSSTNTIDFNYVNIYDEDISLSYTLDDSGRVLNYKNKFPNFGCEYDFEFDENGNLIKETFDDMVGKGEVIYEYDSDSKLIKKDQTTEMEKDELTYTYDKNGNLISVERYNKLTGKTKKEVTYKYDKNGRLIQCTDKYSGTTVEKYKYNKKGFLTSYSIHSKGGAIKEYKLSITYKYNAAGDIIKKTTNENGTKTVQKYSYDEFGDRI